MLEKTPIRSLITLVTLAIGASLTGCVVAPVPARPVVVNPGPVYVAPAPAPVYVAPAYASPGVGWVWIQHPRYGWGWHHPDHGWHRGWR
ncbi:MAG: hypothetical protein JZU58_10205 [Curvibacter lanceolatus]|uniref:hypothetical protein n=1 Tax=Curvibacter lanceolatus TaxID=86182 RepID=UPI000374F939|nr:hypothetical protein [Curvibacter lanceolatus]MBV5292710.1 hypothetical protein [Curvibacter lanceolatus]